MKFNIEIIQKHKIAYMRSVGEYGVNNFLIMEHLKKWIQEKKLYKNSGTIFGIAHDNPNTTNKENCRYDVGVIIENDDIIDERVMLGSIAKGLYFIFEIEHTEEAVINFWQEFYQIIRQNGYEIDAQRLILERYKIELVNKHRCEFCVPIV